MEWIIIMFLAVSSPQDDNMIAITHANNKPLSFPSAIKCRLHASVNIGNLIAYANKEAPGQKVEQVLCVKEKFFEQLKGQSI